jgi:predicted anti-sigma-YlaC factor YlaD
MCDQVRESISATLDGEAAPLVDDVVAAHLASCPACAEWRVDVEAMQRRVRLGAAPVLADQTERFVTAVQQDQAQHPQASRRLLPVQVGLVLVALSQLALSSPVLLLGRDHAAPEHVAHELGAFSVAIAIGLLLAAFRPRLATGMVPILGIVSLLLVLTAWVDAVLRYTQISQESPHLLEVAGFVLLLRLSYLSNDRDWTPLLLPLRRGHSAPRRPPGTSTDGTTSGSASGPAAGIRRQRAAGE